jgi:hypothetical protein
MFWKRLASAGSCLTMSPPLNTASMYCHMLCTVSHCSKVSPTAASRPAHAATPSRNGAA